MALVSNHAIKRIKEKIESFADNVNAQYNVKDAADEAAALKDYAIALSILGRSPYDKIQVDHSGRIETS